MRHLNAHDDGMTTGIKIAMTVGALFVASGCSGGGGDEPGKPSATVTVTETVTAAPSPDDEAGSEESPADGASAKMGKALTTEWGTVTVKQFDPNVTTDPSSMRSEGATRWSGALVRSCVDADWGGEAIKLSWNPWTLTDKAGGNFLASLMSGGVFFPTPTYPQMGDRTTRPGTCTEGWIVFNTSNAGRFSEAVYEGQGLPEPLAWSIS